MKILHMNLTWAHDQRNYNHHHDEEKDEDDDHPQSEFQADGLIQLSLYPAHSANLKAELNFFVKMWLQFMQVPVWFCVTLQRRNSTVHKKTLSEVASTVFF